MTTSPISAFHMDGPWLSPEFGPPPQNVSPTSLSANSLAMKFRDSELPDEFVVALIEAILRWSNSGFDGLSQQNRQCVLYTLGLFPQPGPGLINNVTGPRIRNIMLPVLVLDHLLHGAQPASTAVLKHRNPNRPPSHYKHNHHFQRYNKWHEVLTKAAKLHEEGKRIKSKADQASEFAEEGGVRQEAIESLSTLNNLSVPGDVAVYNITQAAFMLRAIQKGVMELTEENIVDLAWSQARETDPTIPRHEVKAAVSNPNLQGIPAALAVAVAASPIYLLSGQNYAQSIYNPGTSIYHMWLSSGNSHIVNLEHPLGKLDRLFWQLLPKLFASTEMKLALEGKHTPEILGALIHYISDEKMETINEPEDLETERQMAQFLELTRKQVQEQEARLEEEKRKGEEEEKRKAEELLQLPEQPATPNKDNEDPANATKADESGKEEKRKQPATPNKDNEDPANARKADESGKDDKKEDDKKDEPKKRKGKVPPEPSTRELRSSKKNPADKTETVAATVAPAARSKSKKPQSLQRGRFFTWNASRPLHPNVMDLVLYAPGSIAGDFVDTSFQYTMFQKFESDREMLKAMFASQPKDAKNMPTFLDNSARNPNPKLQASATQSIFFVCTEKEYSALTPSMKHQIHRHRCVILVDVYMQDPSPPFNRETMQEFRDPDALCSLQGNCLP
ncbi:hypothetical protein R3P38DRAFT_3188498 [Favolaschia claudopus]|uniref:Uncharacterized protein n=1 Tax=Favolaschia claudopus TaxID=2862362 RepID=A0AAW0BX68_9AGAR